MFTSGTTGDPKGVMLTHRNLTANIEGITQFITCDTSSRLLSILPLSHMYERWVASWPFYTSAPV